MSVRVRFAPSPTGYLHIGGARTALFNYLFARHHQGKFLLRIEDTDPERSKGELTLAILRSLEWMGLSWDDEMVLQSDRLDRHREVVMELVARGAAYPCFCSAGELAKKRERAQKEKREYRYDRTCLNLTPKEIQARIENGAPRTIRLKVPEGETRFQDRVRGDVTVNNREIDDFILLRSDDTAIYQVAVVADDHDMRITHVIRGDDHLSNTPKQILIYQAMGWDLPQFAHVPLILGPDKKRLSKRHGAASVEEYKTAGYLPETLVNFLALLGWSPGDDREIMTRDELIQAFALDRITKNAAVFDETKLQWMSGQYIGQLTNEALVDILKPMLDDAWIKDEAFLSDCVALMKPRMKRLSDFREQAGFFFADPQTFEEKAVKKHWKKEGVAHRLETLLSRLEAMEEWSEEALEKVIRGLAEELDVGAGKVIHPVRLALTGSGSSPGLFEMMALLGQKTVSRRLKAALKLV